MRRIILLLTATAMLAVSAAPASAASLNGTVQCSVHSTLECTDAQLGLGGNIT
jgi:hypothetical protein